MVGQSAVRRIRLFLRRNYGYGPLLGLLLVIGGVEAGYHGHPYWLTFLVGIGTSVIAAALVTLLSPTSDEMYQQFLALGIRDIWPSRRDVPPANWCEWLGQTKKNCTLLGVAHGEWRNDERFEPALRACLIRDDVHVRILFLNPNSTLAQARAGEEQRDTPTTIRDSIRIMSEMRLRLAEPLRGRLHLYVYDSTPSSGATWVDDFMIVTHYLAGYPNRTSPAFRVVDVGQDSLFGVFGMNIRRILDRASTVEITEANIAEYT
jgi:hypothetical protein